MDSLTLSFTNGCGIADEPTSSRVDDDVEHERLARSHDLQSALQRWAQLIGFLHTFAHAAVCFGLLHIVRRDRLGRW